MVKIHNKGIKKILHNTKLLEIIQHTEQVRKDTTKKKTTLTLASHLFIAI